MRPSFAKISHVSFSARDAEATAKWWRDVMGFVDIDRSAGAGWFGILLMHLQSATIVEFQQHQANQGELFDPVRSGFDHMGLLVSDPAELADWEEHFRVRGVVHTRTARHDYGEVLTFWDPDLRQYEIFYRNNHPSESYRSGSSQDRR